MDGRYSISVGALDVRQDIMSRVGVSIRPGLAVKHERPNREIATPAGIKLFDGDTG